MENQSAIKKATQILGGTNALARAAGVKPPTASEWLKGKRPVPSGRCPSIERATNGLVTCEELLPDFDWKYLRSSKSQAA